MAVLGGGKLVTAHVGDSRAVLCTGDPNPNPHANPYPTPYPIPLPLNPAPTPNQVLCTGEGGSAIRLTEDHKPNRPDEVRVRAGDS